MIRVAICDDDPALAGQLESLLLMRSSTYSQQFEIEVFFSGGEFCRRLNETGETFDIVFMDIRMKGITGIEAGRRLRGNIANELTLLIFVSGYQDYYADIIDLNVFCFLPKPLCPEEFELKLDKAVKRLSVLRQFPQYSSLLIRVNRVEMQIPTGAILYLESKGRHIHLHMREHTHKYYGKMDEEEQKLPAQSFFRIHQSYIINFSHVTSIAPVSVTMADGRRLPISTPYHKKAAAGYMKYRGGTYWGQK